MKSLGFKTSAGAVILFLLTAVLIDARLAGPAHAAEKPELFVQMGHSGKVTSVAISPDGKYALSGAEDYTLKLWEIATGREIRTFKGHTDWVYAVAISPDGRQALSGGKDDTVRLWDLATGTEIRTFRGVWVNCVAFSADGRQILSGSANDTLHIWDAATGAEIRQSTGQPAETIAFTAGGRLALSANWDNSLKIWDPASGKELRTFKGHAERVTAAAVSADGRYALSGSKDKTVRLWEMDTGKAIRTFKGHSDFVTTVAFSPDGRYALSGSWDNTLMLWDIASGKALRTFKGHSFRVQAAAWSPDGRTILSGSADYTLLLWDAATAKPLRMYAGFVRPVTSMAVSPDGRFALSASEDKTLMLWDVANGAEVRMLKGHKGQVFAAAFSPDGRYAVSASEDKTAKLWDVATGSELRTFSGHENFVAAAAFSPDGRQMLSASWDHTLKLWDVATGREIKTFTGHNGQVIAAAISPDGKYALSGSEDYTAILWDIASGREIRTFKHDGRIPAAVFSPDGKRLLTGGSDKVLVLWEIATGKEIRTFKGHTDWVESAAFSPDGRYVLSGSEDMTLKLWDAATGAEIKTFRGHAGKVNSVAFSPDGRLALSGSGSGITFIAFHGSGGDNTTRIWDISGGKEIVRFVSFIDGEWVAVTGDGYFKASKYGPASLNIRQGGQVFGLDQFYDVFYRPDIVEANLRGEDISALAATNLEEALRNPPPMVEFINVPSETADKKVAIGYRITSNSGGGIGEVRLFHNGKLIRSDGFYRQAQAATANNAATLLANNSRAIREDLRSVAVVARQDNKPSLIESAPKGDVYEGSIIVDAIAGENDIGLAAFNRNNSVQSILRTATFTSTLRPDDANLYILSIGIDEYRSQENNLKYAVKDAESIAQKLQEQSKTQYKSKNIHISMLNNGNASKTNIMNKIKELSGAVRPTDVFVLFIASHGVLQSGLYSIVTHDYNGNLDSGSMINSNEIMDISKNIKALTQIFILDTCHAGGLDNFVSGLYDARMTVMARNMGLHIFASASSTQEALDGYKGENGMFTYTLLEGLNNNRNADTDKDGKVSIYELGSYAKDRTVKLSGETGHTQTPLINDFGKDVSVYVIK